MSAYVEHIGHDDPIAWLKHDHRAIETLLERLVSGSPGMRLSTLEELKKVLAMHNAIEENLVYPALAEVAARREEAMELFHETAEANLLVFAAQRALDARDDATFVSSVTQLRRAVLGHIRTEEDDAFPLLSRAPAAEVKALGTQILQFRNVLLTTAQQTSRVE